LAATATAAGCYVSPPEQLSALRTLYIGIKKAKLKKSWDSASLRIEILKGNIGQYKSEDQNFKGD
jgi:hypothetical protein